MTCRTILQWPDKQLSQKSAPVGGEITSDDLSDIQDVIDTLRASFGVGLAAPQVGIKKRILAISPEAAQIENPYPQEAFPDHFVVVDPELNLSGNEFTWNEACLSVPFMSAPVRRKPMVNLEFTNLAGERVSLDLRMPLSGIVQHEADHLDGILFIDRAGKFFKDKLVKKLKKETRILKKTAEKERQQIILETQGQAALRKYLSKKPGTKKPAKKKSGKQFGRNKKRR